MEKIRFIQVSSLNLNIPFKGLQNVPAKFEEEILQSPYIGLRRLAKLSETLKPDFIIIAGGIYEKKYDVIRPQIALQKFSESLHALDIPIYISLNSKDPLAEMLVTLPWPDNVYFFDSSTDFYAYKKNGEIAAKIYEVNFNQNKIEDLSNRIIESEHGKLFKLGIQSHSLSFKKNGSLNDFIKNSGLNALALGGRGNWQILSNSPLILSSGCLQGTENSESGVKGCVLAEATVSESGWQYNVAFKPLAPVIWTKLDFEIFGIDGENDLIKKIKEEIDKHLINNSSESVSKYIFQISLNGESSQYYKFREKRFADKIVSFLNSSCNLENFCFIQNIIMNVSEPEMEKIEQDSSLMGGICQYIKTLQNSADNPDEIFQTVMEKFLSHNLASNYEGILKPVLEQLPHHQILQQAATYAVNCLRKN